MYKKALDPIGSHGDSRVFANVDIALHWAAKYSVGHPDVAERILYRGQANADWDLVPSLLRDHHLPQHEREAETQRFLEALLREFPEYDSLTELQLQAIAQHYGFPTELLDYTLDPKVAAFFAAPGGKPKGQFGLIQFIAEREHNEFQNLFAPLGLPDDKAQELMKREGLFVGHIDVIKVPGVPRIERQKAVFVWGSSPGILRETYLDRYCFPQDAQEAYLDPAGFITFDHLFPSEDPIYKFVEKYDSSKSMVRLYQYASERTAPAGRHRSVKSTPRTGTAPSSVGLGSEDVESWKAFRTIARTALDQLVSSPANEASAFKVEIDKLVDVLSRELQGLQKGDQARLINRALARIAELPPYRFYDANEASTILEDVRHTLAPMVQGRNHAIATEDPFRGALGEIAAFVVALAHVQYVNAHASPWEAKQTAKRSAGDRLRDARNYFGWLDQ